MLAVNTVSVCNFILNLLKEYPDGVLKMKKNFKQQQSAESVKSQLSEEALKKRCTTQADYNVAVSCRL